jgi:hypothetical protein
MRVVHFFAVSAAVTLGASIVSLDRAQAQGLLEMAPPAASSAQIGQPKYDIKFETGTAQPPKTGSAAFLNGRPMEWLTPLKKARAGAARIRSK